MKLAGASAFSKDYMGVACSAELAWRCWCFDLTVK